MDASSSARALEALPGLAALQSWVYRPQALAPCFDAWLTTDVFLLNHFPCKFVELVGWVAGVDHKDASMTISLDDGDGECVLNIIVKLVPVEIPVEKEKGKEKERRATFRSAQERAARPPPPQAQVYIRPDIRVGDTVRLSGYVEEWMRKTETVRQVVVNEASGTGYIRVVDPDEQFVHVENVARLHHEVYSRPFETTATALPASVRSSPPKSMSSTWDMSSELDAVEDDLGHDLPDPSKLSSSRLTEMTFKYYLMDHIVRETKRAMRSATRILLADPSAQVPELAALFPEYDACTVPPRQGRRMASPCPSPSPSPKLPVGTCRASPTPKPRRTATLDVLATSCAENSPACETPRPRATFRSKAEREAAKAQGSGYRGSQIDECTPTVRGSRSTFRIKTERERQPRQSPSPFVVEATPRALPADTSFLSALDPLSFEPFTVTALLAEERLRTLAALVVETRARREEHERRKRVREGRITQEDAKVVADRRARGLRSSDYKLRDDERQRKMARLVTWAIRVAAAEGEVVQVDGAMHSLRTMESFNSCVSLSVLTQEAGYVPLAPELLGPLLIPLAAAARAERRPTFRSRAEREAGVRREDRGIDTSVLLTRLRRWGEDGRWERIAEQPVQEAAEWAEASGLLRLGV